MPHMYTLSSYITPAALLLVLSLSHPIVAVVCRQQEQVTASEAKVGKGVRSVDDAD